MWFLVYFLKLYLNESKIIQFEPLGLLRMNTVNVRRNLFFEKFVTLYLRFIYAKLYVN